MDRTLTGFVRALRAAGADASTAETLDAARAMALVGFADRETLKASLAVALAKSQDEKLICERVFEQYFSLPADAADAQQAESARAAGDAPGPRTGPPEVDALLDLAEGTSPGQTAAALMRAAQSVGVDDIRFSSQIAYLTRRTLEALGIAALEARLQQAAAGGAAEVASAEAARLGAARDRLQRQVRALV